jgi:FtsP/CotA-like multicopper oxidase with cupredoxin domain
MKWTALLALAVVLLAVGSATAAPQAIRGTVVAKRAHSGTVVLAAGRRGLAVTVRVAPRRVRLGDRVSVVGKRLRDGTVKASRLRVLSHVKTARLRGMVVKRLAHTTRVASGHSVLTIHTRSSRLASRHDGEREGDIGEFEVEFEHGHLVEDDFTPAPGSGTVEIEGHLISVSPLVVSLDGLPIEITVPSSMTLPPLTPGQEVELVVQTGTGNTFTLVRIESAANDDEDENEVEAKGTVTDSTASHITIDAGGALLTFAAPTGHTLPVIATGTFVEARGATIDGVLTLTRLRVEDCDGDGGGSGPDDGGCGH